MACQAAKLKIQNPLESKSVSWEKRTLIKNGIKWEPYIKWKKEDALQCVCEKDAGPCGKEGFTETQSMQTMYSAGSMEVLPSMAPCFK